MELIMKGGGEMGPGNEVKMVTWRDREVGVVILGNGEVESVKRCGKIWIDNEEGLASETSNRDLRM